MSKKYGDNLDSTPKVTSKMSETKVVLNPSAANSKLSELTKDGNSMQIRSG